MSEPESVEHHHQGDFWSQVPVVLFTIAAVVALFWVNNRTQDVPESPSPPAASEVRQAPAGCAECGEIIAIRPVPAGDPNTPAGAVLLDVRMTDGSVRTIMQLSTGFDVGDHVQVNGNALVAGG